MRYSRSAIAKIFSVSVSSVIRWTTIGVRGRKLRSYLVGGRRFVDVGDLEAFLADDTAPPAAKGSGVASDRAAQELSSRWGL